MSTEVTLERTAEVPASVRWLLVFLTTGLAWLAVFQIVAIMPMCKYTADRLGIMTPRSFKALLSWVDSAAWLPFVAALILTVLAIANWRSVLRLALLNTLTIAGNFGLMLILIFTLWKIAGTISRAG